MDENPKFVSAKKGLYRLWLTLSVIWWLLSLIVIIVLFLTNSYHDYVNESISPELPPPEQFQGAYNTNAPSVATNATYSEDYVFNEVFEPRSFQWTWFLLSIILAVLPPFAIYLFSKACYWTYRGFKEDKES